MITIITWFLFISFGIWAIILALKSNEENPNYIIFLLAMGLFRPSGSLPGGFDLSSMWLLFNILLLIIIWLKNDNSYYGIKGIVGIYIIYFIYAITITIFSLDRTTSLSFALRVFLKQLYPLLVLIITANIFRRSEYLDLAMKRTVLVTFIAAIFIGGYAEKYWPFTLKQLYPYIWSGAAFTDHSAIITSIALIWWSVTNKKKYLFAALLLCISTVLAGNRTGITATVIGISLFLTFRYGTIKSIPFLFCAYIIGMSILFLYPDVQQRMFFDPSTVDAKNIIRDPTIIDFDNIRTSGRSLIWEDLLNKFWRPQPLTGAGLGAVQNYLYSPWNVYGANHAHSSYVEISCDTGIIGLVLFISIYLACILTAYRVFLNDIHPYARIAAGFVFCTVPSLFFIMGFDGAISCATAVMQYSFIFTGITIGLSRQENEKHDE